MLRAKNSPFNNSNNMDKELLNKYFKGEASREEEIQIINWTNQSQENLEEFLNEHRMYNLILMNKYSNNSKHPKQIKALRLHRIYKYVASIAAVTLLTISLIYIAKYNYNGKKQITLADITEPMLLINDESQCINLKEKSFAMTDKQHINIKNDNSAKLLSLQNDKEKSETKTVGRTENRLLIPHGRIYTVVLSDSTIVTLNAESELIFPNNFGDVREVNLKGEAYFQVAKTGSPFIVHADNINIRVLGTKFNISNYPNERNIKTTLVEGSVQMEHNDETIRIKPSEQIVFDKKNLKSQVGIVDTDIYTSWTNNEYIFRNNTLEEILLQIGHWYKFDANYENYSLRNKRFTFSIGHDASLKRIIEFINSTEEVKLEINNNSINIKDIKYGIKKID